MAPSSDRFTGEAIRTTRIGRQRRAFRWVGETFGHKVAHDVRERAFRFAEEACELLQAVGLSREDVLHVVDYVFGRPVGDLRDEAGGAGLTLLVLCEALELDADQLEDASMRRALEVDREAIRAKQNRKAEAGIAQPVAED